MPSAATVEKPLFDIPQDYNYPLEDHQGRPLYSGKPFNLQPTLSAFLNINKTGVDLDPEYCAYLLKEPPNDLWSPDADEPRRTYFFDPNFLAHQKSLLVSFGKNVPDSEPQVNISVGSELKITDKLLWMSGAHKANHTSRIAINKRVEAYMSRFHALANLYSDHLGRILWIKLIDMGSSNGTYVLTPELFPNVVKRLIPGRPTNINPGIIEGVNGKPMIIGGDIVSFGILGVRFVSLADSSSFNLPQTVKKASLAIIEVPMPDQEKIDQIIRNILLSNL